MGRYETIEAVIRMKEQYSKDGNLSVQEMREKYYNKELPSIGPVTHRRIVEHACLLAENAIKFRLGENYIERALTYLGVCLDAMKYRLDWKKAAEDLNITEVWHEHNKHMTERRRKIRTVLNKSNELVSEDERQDIYNNFKLDKDCKKAVTDGWHRIIVGQSQKLASAVLEKGGTEEEIKLALKYYIVCIDVNKYMLDYKKFKQECGITELAEKYSVRIS